jgi:ankyrin repeat protein
MTIIIIVLIISGCQKSDDQLLNNEKKQAAQTVNNEMDKLNKGLLTAAEQGNLGAITKLIAEGADINATDRQGRTSAMIAVHANKLDVLTTW